SGDLSWNVREKTSPLFSDGTIDIESLGFRDGAGGSSEPPKQEDKRWREIEVAKNGKSIVFFLPREGENISSGDRM
ncbi:MAG: hypothetical protein LBK91_06265, partial [Synergistaceae bacterium]|nr:hypothetical protein [Synergistaceae bacterium]